MVKVSVVIPTYNRADVLQRAIDSVLQQTIANIELIVVDDGSTDDTKDIIESYTDERIRYIKFDVNRGANEARKIGIEKAKGKYVAFLDSDDEWLPTKIEKQIDYFESSTDDVGVVYTGIKYVNEDGLTNSVSTPDIEGDVSKQILCDNFVGTFSSPMFKSETIDDVGYPDGDFSSGQDWEFLTRCALNAQFGCVSDPLVIYYTGQENRISNTHIPKEKYADYRSKYMDEINDFGILGRRRIHSCHMFGLGYSSIRKHKFHQARVYFLKSIYLYPFDEEYYLHMLASLGGEQTYLTLQKIKRYLHRIIRDS